MIGILKIFTNSDNKKEVIGMAQTATALKIELARERYSGSISFIKVTFKEEEATPTATPSRKKEMTKTITLAKFGIAIIVTAAMAK